MTDDARPILSLERSGWLADLFRSERPRLARYVRKRVRDDDDAADLLQEAFVRLASTDSARVQKPEAYLQRVLRNLIVDRSRRPLPRLAEMQPLDERLLPVVAPEQELVIEMEDLKRRYREALDTLTPRTREIFLLHRVEELTYRDIAHKLGIVTATVEYHMSRALIHLDEALGE